MNYGDTSEEPLLRFSTDCERASFIDDDENSNDSMTKKRRTKAKGKKGKKTKRVQSKGIKLNKGKVSIRLAGFGLQKLGASELVKFISLSKLKTAAKKFLQSKGLTKTRRKRRKQNR
jgi:hypothetical protein